MGSRAKKMQLFLAKFSKIGISLLFLKKKRPKQPTPSPPETTNPPPPPSPAPEQNREGQGEGVGSGTGALLRCVYGGTSAASGGHTGVCFKWGRGGGFRDKVGDGVVQVLRQKMANVGEGEKSTEIYFAV